MNGRLLPGGGNLRIRGGGVPPSHPFLDLASKFHTRFYTWSVGNYVIIT